MMRAMTPQERGEKAASLKKSGAAKRGATICKDIKGRDTGRVLCECPECCRNAVLAAEGAFGADAP